MEKTYLCETVQIEKIVSGGYGLARLPNQKILFIKHVLPQEIVEVRYKENKKDFSFGRVQEYKETSPLRIQAQCPLFETCGGCQYQMVSYEHQLKIKYGIIEENLSRIGKLETINLLQPIVPSPQVFHYRNKGSFQVFEQGKIGFCKPGTTFPFSVNYCYLMEEAINQRMEFYQQAENQVSIASLKSLNIRSNIKGEVIDSSKKRDSFYDQVENLSFLVDVDTFFQVNRGVIPLWLDFIRAQVQLHSKGELLVDLFCGVGLIGQYLAPLFKKVIGVEINKRLVENGQVVLEKNGITNMQIIEQDAAIFWEQTEIIDTLILNPPRSGLSHPMIQSLLNKKPSTIIYSSCNPDTFARDLQILVEQGQYHIGTITPFDMFPQTSHAEIVTLLYQ